MVRIDFGDKGQGWKQGDQTVGYCINPGKRSWWLIYIKEGRKGGKEEQLPKVMEQKKQ